MIHARAGLLIGAVLLALPALAQAPDAQPLGPKSGSAAGSSGVRIDDAPSQSPATGPAATGPFVPLAPGDLLASNLIDLPVKDARGGQIGEIEDLVLGTDHDVRSVVIAAGGYRGGNVRHIAVALSALRIGRTADGKWEAVLPLTPDEINAAPTVAYKSGFNEN